MSYQTFIDHYCQVTKLPLKYDPLCHDSDIYLFLKKFSEGDLGQVAKHIRARYAGKEDFMIRMLSFRYLIRQLDTFGEILAEANAMSIKHRKPSERDKTLMATGRAPEGNAERPAKSARQVLRRMSKDELAQGWAAVKAGLDMPANPEMPPDV